MSSTSIVPPIPTVTLRVMEKNALVKTEMLASRQYHGGMISFLRQILRTTTKAQN